MTATKRDGDESIAAIAKELNRMRGSSASGRYVVIDLADGSVGSTLFTAGSHPRLAATERLVSVGGRWTAAQVADLYGI